MKVTVCFGSVRIVVPCGDGQILVRDLIQKATDRYKKATGKRDSWVQVHSLQSQSDGGLLDPDDRLNDVADDREQIIANFEDGEGQHHHGGGDGASGSSVGTGSPDIFQDGGVKYTDIEVTGEQIASGLVVAPLVVRRGSESALNQLVASGSSQLAVNQPGSRVSSAAPGVPGTNIWSQPEKRHYKKEHRPARGYPNGDWYGPGEEDRHPPGRFARDGSNRLSMQFLGEGAGFRWADAAERAAVVAVGNANNRAQSKSLPRDHRRKEPLGQANCPPIPSHTQLVSDSDLEADLASDSVQDVVIRAASGPLGIHVVPDYDARGKDRGLLVQGIEPGGRVDRDGRLALFDRIIEINGSSLLDMPFHRVQEIFKDSLRSNELALRVIKHGPGTPGINPANRDPGRKPPPPVFPRGRIGEDKENEHMVEGRERQVSPAVATVTATKKASPGHGAVRGSSLLSANTRKIGRKIELELVKGPHGLGFSITTRDNPAGGNCPIYIKNILTKGAAVSDGRLRPGDRLLEVNGVEMTGRTQSEAVAVLRDAAPGSSVHIVVSRQEESHSPKLPRQIAEESSNELVVEDRLIGGEATRTTDRNITQPSEKVSDDSHVFPWKHREILTFDIPVHDTEKAGLGVSVKGKTTASQSSSGSPGSANSALNTSIDLGIFVKSVLHGGAASRDGRLRTNDQLLSVNDISLLAQSNSDAMETLRRAMLGTDGPVPGVISITVARRASSPATRTKVNGFSENGVKDESSCTPDNSGASENSDTTVIFLPIRNQQQNNRENFNQSQNGRENFNQSRDGRETFGQSRDSREILNQSRDGREILNQSRDSRDILNQSRDSRDILNQSQESNDSGRTLDGKNRNGGYEMAGPRNPVLARLTGQPPPGNALRNESYYRATNDVWNATVKLGGGGAGRLNSPTVNMQGPDMVLIEEEFHTPTTPSTPSEGGVGPGPIDATYTSQLSLEEAAGFSRDAFGRQSMSEKRHATLDAKHTDTYQRNKRIREERESERFKHNLNQQQLLANRAGSVESVASAVRSQADSERSNLRARNEFGPSLGMKKSSSLESLQTMVQEIQMSEDGDPAYSYRNAAGAVRVIRGRGCNESFRAAVDRSYEAPLDGHGRPDMDTLDEESLGEMQTFGPRGGPRQSSMNAAIDKGKPGKKKPGLFRGIGSMFRFGKHRKTLESGVDPSWRQNVAEGAESSQWRRGDEAGQEAARRAAQEEQQRIQEQYRRLMNRQRQQENDAANAADYQQSSHRREGSVSSSHQGPPGPHPGPQGPHPGAPQGPNQVRTHQREGSSSSVQLGQQQGQPTNRPQPPPNINFHFREAVTLPGYQNREPPAVREPPGPAISRDREGSTSSRDREPTSRTERIHQLRAQHQRRHAQRLGQYPLDEAEEQHEQVLRQRLDQPEPSNRTDLPNRFEPPSNRLEKVQNRPLEKVQNRPGLEIYGEMCRPGSRAAIADPQRFSHYVNYEEIQIHLNKRKEQLSDSQIVQMRRQVQHQRFKVEEESRRQQHYHSQRRDTRDQTQRPVSNFYEYESVQAVLRANQQRLEGDEQSNSLPRPNTQRSVAETIAKFQSAVDSGGMRNERRQGPFVTQVMIGQSDPPGSKRGLARWLRSMRTKSFVLFLLCVVATSVLLILVGNQRPSISSLVSASHKQLESLQRFQVGLVNAGERKLLGDSKQLSLLGFVSEPRLFPTAVWKNSSLPVIVTYVLSGQEQQGVGFVRSAAHFLPNHTALVYDLGLGATALLTLQSHCNGSRCAVLPFDLSRFPSHVQDERVRAFRPLIIQDALNRAGAVLFLESDLRLASAKAAQALASSRAQGGVTAWATPRAVSSLTHPKMFEYFQTGADDFLFLPMVEGSKLLLFNTEAVHTQVMLPWVQCALTQDCVHPIGAQDAGCRFDKKPQYRYSGCHRGDTSALNVVLGLHFHLDENKYAARDAAELFRRVLPETAAAELAALEANATDSSTTSDS